jgi:hypothetical protein
MKKVRLYIYNVLHLCKILREKYYGLTCPSDLEATIPSREIRLKQLLKIWKWPQQFTFSFVKKTSQTPSLLSGMGRRRIVPSWKSGGASGEVLMGQRRGLQRRHKWSCAPLRHSEVSSPWWLDTVISYEAPRRAPSSGRGDLLLVGSSAVGSPSTKASQDHDDHLSLRTFARVGGRDAHGDLRASPACRHKASARV